MKNTLIILFLTSVISGCMENNTTSKTDGKTDETDPAAMTRAFLPGLWSLDSNSRLCDAGFLFQPDGTLEKIGTGQTGSWQLSGADTLVLKYTVSPREDISQQLRISAISLDRMTVISEKGLQLFRKVPFGLAPQEEVLTGYVGSLSMSQQEKLHRTTLPSAKKIGLRISSTDSTLRFELLQEAKNLTGIPAIEWNGILVNGGDFQIRVSSIRPEGLTATGSEYDLKVIAY